MQRVRHTDESRYTRVLEDYDIIITLIETTIMPSRRFRKGSRKGQIDQRSAWRRTLVCSSSPFVR